MHCSITEMSQLKLGNVVKGTEQTLRKRTSVQKNVKRQEKLERGFPLQVSPVRLNNLPKYQTGTVLQRQL